MIPTEATTRPVLAPATTTETLALFPVVKSSAVVLTLLVEPGGTLIEKLTLSLGLILTDRLPVIVLPELFVSL